MTKLHELIPTCIGEVEAGDPACDGDPAAASPEAHAPCSWRERCMGFQLHLQHSGEQRSERIRLVTLTGQVKARSGLDETAEPVGMKPAAFARFCRSAWEAYGPRSPTEPRGKATPAPTPPAPASVGPRAPRKGGRARRSARERDRAMKDRRAAFSARRGHLLSRLKAALPSAIRLRATRLLLPGDVHAVTEWERGRCTVYVREAGGRDRGLVRLQHLPSTASANVMLNTDIRKLASVVSRATLVKLDPKPTTMSNFPVIIRAVDDEAISLVAESFGRLIQRKLIQLGGGAQ